jgi:hypothetical protein
MAECAVSASAVPARFADETGRSNGTNVEQVHVYGGNGYNFGLVALTAGMKFNNFIVEGAQVAQAKIGTQVKVDSFHAYTGGINTAAAVGIQFGDSTHTGVNGVTIKSGVIENCGGGAGGASGGTLTQQVGPLKIFRTGSGDTRNLFDLRTEANTALAYFDYRGRLFLRAAGTTTFAAGANAGAGASVSASSTSNDQRGTITVTTGTSPGTGDAALVAVTFSSALGATPDILLTPANAAARAANVPGQNAATGNWTLYVKDPPASTLLKYSYLVLP